MGSSSCCLLHLDSDRSAIGSNSGGHSLRPRPRSCLPQRRPPPRGPGAFSTAHPPDPHRGEASPRRLGGAEAGAPLTRRRNGRCGWGSLGCAPHRPPREGFMSPACLNYGLLATTQLSLSATPSRREWLPGHVAALRLGALGYGERPADRSRPGAPDEAVSRRADDHVEDRPRRWQPAQQPARSARRGEGRAVRPVGRRSIAAIPPAWVVTIKPSAASLRP